MFKGGLLSREGRALTIGLQLLMVRLLDILILSCVVFGFDLGDHFWSQIRKLDRFCVGRRSGNSILGKNR